MGMGGRMYDVRVALKGLWLTPMLVMVQISIPIRLLKDNVHTHDGHLTPEYLNFYQHAQTLIHTALLLTVVLILQLFLILTSKKKPSLHLNSS